MKHRLLGLIIIAVALLQTLSIEAQRPFATLEHEGTMTAYYGYEAFKQAYNAAADGDIITLSPGTFNGAVTINKPVIVRGAGMYNDTLAGTPATVLSISRYSPVNITNDRDSILKLSFEGIYFSSGDFTIQSANAPIFSKCYIETLSAEKLKYGLFVNCIIARANYQSECTACSFVNSVILTDNGSSPSKPPLGSTLTNCFAFMWNYASSAGQTDVTNYNITNSVLYCNQSYNFTINNTMGSSYSIGINAASGRSYFNSAYAPLHHLYNYSSLAAVFKNFDGTITANSTLELQDSIANTILGSDGTQVGIFGGSYPFNPRVQNYKITVPAQSNESGQLPITIQAVTED